MRWPGLPCSPLDTPCKAPRCDLFDPSYCSFLLSRIPLLRGSTLSQIRTSVPLLEAISKHLCMNNSQDRVLFGCSSFMTPLRRKPYLERSAWFLYLARPPHTSLCPIHGAPHTDRMRAATESTPLSVTGNSLPSLRICTMRYSSCVA